LKSPHHTCRIKLLLDMFPDARFVHIHRNPYKVFQSSRRQIAVALRTNCLQHPDTQSIDAMIIRRYKMMYDVFFEERDLIPEGRFHEVSYEELERIALTGKADLRAESPVLMQYSSRCSYIDSITAIGKPAPELLSLRKEITQSWESLRPGVLPIW
jgi:hypothetical protein